MTAPDRPRRLVLGVDPGIMTALVLRDCAARRATDGLVGLDYLDRRRGTWDDAGWARHVVRHAAQLLTSHGLDLTGGFVVAVEDVVPPVGHARGRSGLIDPGPLIQTAKLAGAVTQAFAHTARLVRPAGFGPAMPSRAVLCAAYPAGLIGDRETTGGGKTRWQHLRAAWDCAGACPR